MLHKTLLVFSRYFLEHATLLTPYVLSACFFALISHVERPIATMVTTRNINDRDDYPIRKSTSVYITTTSSPRIVASVATILD